MRRAGYLLSAPAPKILDEQLASEADDDTGEHRQPEAFEIWSSEKKTFPEEPKTRAPFPQDMDHPFSFLSSVVGGESTNMRSPPTTEVRAHNATGGICQRTIKTPPSGGV